MIEFGKTLVAAREAKGYSIGQLADMTHMPPTTIEDLEKEEFSRIAAPIYGRGFIKLYCSAVGIDPKPLVDEFMAIYTGERDVGIKERPAMPTEDARPNQTLPQESTRTNTPPVNVPSEEPRHDEPPPMKPSFELVQETIPAPTPAVSPFAPPPDTPIADGKEPHNLARYAAPIRMRDFTKGMSIHIPPFVWRLTLLAILAGVVLALIISGIRALYRATGPSNNTPRPPATVESVQPTPTDAGTKTPRTPQKIPALYID